jgi:hypothetical protein
VVLAALAAGALSSAALAAKPASDIQGLDIRRAVVEKAERLSRDPAPQPLPADIASPFSPAGFEGAPSDGGSAAPGDFRRQAAAPQTDEALLATVAARIPTTGTIILGGRPLLISGTNRIEVGSHFTVVYSGQEYELELVAIDRTTFTVRYKGEEFTRPIKLGKTP